VGPQRVKISDELVQGPWALLPGPAAAALIVTVHPRSGASEAGQWLQVVPQAWSAMAQHQRLARARGLCPQTAAIAHRHQISLWPAAHPTIITGRSPSSQPVQPVTVVLSGALYPSSTAAMHHDNHVLGRQW
jgi:hypothetical protein